MDHLAEQRGKEAHDYCCYNPGKEAHDYYRYNPGKRPPMVINGPIIVGGGPSGLATAACLRKQGVSSIIIEKSDCIASLWQHRTYNRLTLHLPKHFCELPYMPFPKDFPEYPDKQLFIKYLEDYAAAFDIKPQFNECVVSATFDNDQGFWRVETTQFGALGVTKVEYLCWWLIVATGENAEAICPEFPGKDVFRGRIRHASDYKSGHCFRNQNVLVVGCGNSGMEMSLDLCNHNALPSMVVRDSVHVLPRKMLGISTFGIAMCLLKWLPVKLVDRFLLAVARLYLGNTSHYGVPRPAMGPLELKNKLGKTPVLDVGAWKMIRNGRIKVLPAVECLTPHGAKFVDGTEGRFDSVILATGYKSNVCSWLKGCEDFFSEEGFPRKPFPNGWKAEKGLYAVGFTRKGLLGASYDAKRIAEDIAEQWRTVTVAPPKPKQLALLTTITQSDVRERRRFV